MPEEMSGGFLRDAATRALVIRLVGGGPTTSLSDEIMADTPLGYWRDATGADSSGNELDLTPFGSPTAGTSLDASDPTGTSIVLDGSNNIWNPGLDSEFGLSSEMSLSLLVSPDEVGDLTRDVVGKGFSYGVRTEADGKAHAFVRRLDGSETEVVGLTTITSGETRHIGMSFDGTDLALYVNGVLDGSASHADSIGQVVTSFTLGLSGVYDDGYSGTLDEVALYDYALSGPRFAAHAAAAGTV